MTRIADTLATTVHSLWGGTVTVRCFGKAAGDLAFRGRTPAEAESDNPGITARMDLLVRGLGMTVLAPHANAFNAEIAAPHMFTVAWTDRLLRGPEADAALLDRPKLAFAVASGDCPTLVLRDLRTGMTAAGHAGRDCLYDRAALLDGAPKRRFRSVVDAMITALGATGSDVRDIRAHVFCGAGPDAFDHRYDHPVRGTVNRRMVEHLLSQWGQTCVLGPEEHGKLSLTEIIRAQLVSYGMHPSHIGHDGSDTINERRTDGGYRWHSHRRDADGKRNLVLVARQA